MTIGRVKLRYTNKKVGDDCYQVIDNDTNEVLWRSQIVNNESLWYCVMTLKETEQFIEELL